MYLKAVCSKYVFVLFFKHKTAYEMRISDWSSDVCSSDLPSPRLQGRASPWQGLRDLQEQPALQGAPALRHLPALPGSACVLHVKGRRNAAFCRLPPGVPASASVSRPGVPPRPRAGFGIRSAWPERQSGGEGKGVAGRGDVGGRRKL